jgi:hypothetical protein
MQEELNRHDELPEVHSESSEAIILNPSSRVLWRVGVVKKENCEASVRILTLQRFNEKIRESLDAAVITEECRDSDAEVSCHLSLGYRFPGGRDRYHLLGSERYGSMRLGMRQAQEIRSANERGSAKRANLESIPRLLHKSGESAQLLFG